MEVVRYLRSSAFHIDGAAEMVGDRLKVPGRLSRTGIQEYSIGNGETRREFRPAEEVFDEASLDSLRGMPVTLEHPDTMVTPDNFQSLARGFVDSDVRKDEDGTHVAATIWIHDRELIDLVQARRKRQLSVGYYADLDMTPGTTPDGQKYDAIQRNIRGNHLAAVDMGRAGTAEMRLDSNGNEILPSISDDNHKEGQMKFVVNSVTFDMDEEITRAIQAERDAAKAKLDAAVAEKDSTQAELDAVKEDNGKLQEKIDGFEKAKLDELATKAKADAKRLAGKELEHKSENPVDIMRDALEATGLKMDGKSDAYIEARFDAALDALGEDESKKQTEKVRGSLHEDSDDSEPVETFNVSKILEGN